MSFKVEYHEKVVLEDIPRLSSTVRTRIKSSIEKKLTTQPEMFGKPLRQSLNGYRKLRVGDYRVVFRIDKKTVKVFAIIHRSTVYTKVGSRVGRT